MKDACVFMDMPGSLNDFIYYEETAGLKFDQQAAVIWSWDDHFTHMQEESLDAEASGLGITEPVLNFHITPESKKIDFDEFKKTTRWPLELTKLFHSYYDNCVNPLKKKDEKRKN
jgi:hypothetical protein